MRRAGLLSALLLTAALLCAMPGLLRSFVKTDPGRMEESLRPVRARTLTVWLLGGGRDQKPLNRLCAAFEKQHKGVRVFLRRVDEQELFARDAVLPDAALYLTGQIVNPEQLFLPLSGAEGVSENVLASGRSGGTLYGVPLWVTPNVLSLPARWLGEAAGATPAPESFFDLATPAPVSPEEGSDPDIPWRRLYEPGALWLSGGVGLQQLLFACPGPLRGELVAACRPEEALSPAPGMARVWSLREHRAAQQAGESLMALPLAPAVSDEARYLSLCRDGEDVRAFLRFLLGKTAQEAVQADDLLPVAAYGVARDGLHHRLLELYAGGMLLPNAFAHTRQELLQLTLEGYLQAADPAETLLRLR